MHFDLARKILSLMDLTSLNEKDNAADIALLCDKAMMAHVAAVCIYPCFVPQAAAQLVGHPIKIATVANFPKGNDSLDNVISSIQKSIRAGAQEIDVVFPYSDYLAGKIESSCDYIKKCKETCGQNVLLKVILETGVLLDTQIIAAASRDVLCAGADFLKTSTGKISVGASLPAATVMLMAIKELSTELKRPLGIKISGGVRTILQATEYLDLAYQLMGQGWVAPRTFRFGASQLLEEALKKLNNK